MPDNNAERLLGKVLAQNEDIIKRLDRAEDVSAKMYERFETVTSKLDHLEIRVGALEAKTETLNQSVKRFELYEMQGRTAIALGGYVGPVARRIIFAAGAVVVMFWREILAFFRGA